jgi:hypothetical protein
MALVDWKIGRLVDCQIVGMLPDGMMDDRTIIPRIALNPLKTIEQSSNLPICQSPMLKGLI